MGDGRSVGWVERSETQQSHRSISMGFVGLMRSARLRQHIRSTQPTNFLIICEDISSSISGFPPHGKNCESVA